MPLGSISLISSFVYGVTTLKVNFAPQLYMQGTDGQQYTHSYLGITYQWLTMFKAKGFTLPWSEDWAWQARSSIRLVLSFGTGEFRGHFVVMFAVHAS
jgi:hypothetical protein